MRVVPGLGDWLTAYRVHQRFASRPGAKHIATRRAPVCLSAVVRKHQPKAVLEFGTGIGTITYLLLSASPKLNVVGVEADPFCLAQLERNIPDEFKPRLTVVALNDAQLNGRFDLVVIDGPLPPRTPKRRSQDACAMGLGHE
jgi:predicted O-methyltransferase YrrM